MLSYRPDYHNVIVMSPDVKKGARGGDNFDRRLSWSPVTRQRRIRQSSPRYSFPTVVRVPFCTTLKAPSYGPRGNNIA